MNLVFTPKYGLVPREQLEMKECFGQDENHCWYAIEWYLNGEQVKRYAEVHIIKGQLMELEVKDG